MQRSTKSKVSTRDKIIHELRELTVITAYLFVCFAAVLELKASVLHAHEALLAPLGLAAIKAVICAKFMLLGSAVDVGGEYQAAADFADAPSIVGLPVLLIVLNIFEEAVVGLIHGRTIQASIADLAGGTWYQMIATSFVMLLILGSRLLIEPICRL